MDGAAKVTKGFSVRSFAWSMAAAALVIALNGKFKADAARSNGTFRGLEELFIPAAA